MRKAESEKRLTVGYTRCSTKAQDVEDKAFGRMVQQRAISAWADMQDPPLTIDIWIHDTCSGATLDREGISEVRTLAASGRLARCVFARQDRIARDALLADILYKEVEDGGAEMVNVQMRFERSMVGKILRRILDNFAELDRHQIAERCNKGRIEGVLKNGTHLYGCAILGYQQVKREECDVRGLPHGTLEIVERQAEVVRLIFDLKERGYSYVAIARWLNEKGYKPKRGERFDQLTIKLIVDREGFYRGERVIVSAEKLGLTEEQYAEIKPAHPPILPPREPGVPLLVDRAVSLPKGTAVPDDPFSEPPVPYRGGHVHTLTKDFAQAVLMVRDMRAAGATFATIAEAVRAAGHKSRTGKRFDHLTARNLFVEMDRLEPLALEAVARETPEEAAVVRSDGWEGPLRTAHQMAMQGMGPKRSDMSLGKIAAALNAEFGSTPNGGRFHPATVARLLEQAPPPSDNLRTVAYVRLTKDGVDHHAQVDAVEEWASKNGIEIAEWFVDKAPAYTRADNPELLRLIGECEAGRIHRVAVLAKERFCREKDTADGIARRISAKAELFFVGGEAAVGRHTRKPNRFPYVPARV